MSIELIDINHLKNILTTDLYTPEEVKSISYELVSMKARADEIFQNHLDRLSKDQPIEGDYASTPEENPE